MLLLVVFCCFSASFRFVCISNQNGDRFGEDGAWAKIGKNSPQWNFTSPQVPEAVCVCVCGTPFAFRSKYRQRARLDRQFLAPFYRPFNTLSLSLWDLLRGAALVPLPCVCVWLCLPLTFLPHTHSARVWVRWLNFSFFGNSLSKFSHLSTLDFAIFRFSVCCGVVWWEDEERNWRRQVLPKCVTKAPRYVWRGARNTGERRTACGMRSSLVPPASSPRTYRIYILYCPLCQLLSMSANSQQCDVCRRQLRSCRYRYRYRCRYTHVAVSVGTSTDADTEQIQIQSERMPVFVVLTFRINKYLCIYLRSVSVSVWLAPWLAVG